jgi:pimeloyl-ACP methyl ester carboxylesterase
MTIDHLRTEIRGLQIHALSAGSGERTVLLLHGGGLDSAQLSWELLIQQLSPDFRVLAPDWPGFGSSSKPQKPFQLQDCARLLKQLVDAWEIEHVSLVGISLGGGIAIDFALSNPDQVDRLVLVDSYGLQRKVPLHQLSYLYVQFPGALALTWASMRNRPMVRWALKMLFLQ